MPLLDDFLLEWACLGVDALLAAWLVRLYGQKKQAIRDIKAAPEIDLESPQAHASLLSKTTPSPTATDGSVSECVLLPYAILRGRVQPLHPGTTLPTQYARQPGVAASPPLQGVIQTLGLTEHKKSLSRSGFWFNTRRPIHTFTNDVPFGLAVSSVSATPDLVEVLDWQSASNLVLETTHDHFEQAEATVAGHLVGFISGDIREGVQATEGMLRVDSLLTGVGEVVCSADGAKLKIRAPADGLKEYFLTRSTPQLLMRDLSDQANLFKWMLWAAGGVGLCIGAWIAHRYWSRREFEDRAHDNMDVLQRIREERPPVPPPSTLSSSSSSSWFDDAGDAVNGNGDSNGNGHTCRVCLDKPVEVVLLNCGHVCVCADCAVEIMRTPNPPPKCPICRTEIERVSPAYVS